MDESEIVAIINVGDDLELHGLMICPDIDTITYTLGGLNDDERGWGLKDETWRAMGRLAELGGESWFSLGDQDLATHLYRTQRLREGATKLEVTQELAEKRGLRLTMLPASNDEIATRLDTEVGDLSFQEYFVKHHHGVVTSAVRYVGGSSATPAPGVLDALRSASRIVIAPSNPILSIQPMLEMKEIAELLRARRDDVVAVTPLIGGAALKGPADRLMVELGHESTNAGIAKYYSPYAATLIIDEVDAATTGSVEAAGMRAVVTTTVMSNPSHASALAREVLA
jgi:LPPG:FO 2-phospho-L-lactate transferase